MNTTALRSSIIINGFKTISLKPLRTKAHIKDAFYPTNIRFLSLHHETGITPGINRLFPMYAEGSRRYSTINDADKSRSIEIRSKVCIRPDGWKLDPITGEGKDNVPLLYLILSQESKRNVAIDVFERQTLAITLEKIRQELGTSNVSLYTKNITFFGDPQPRTVRWAESTEVWSIINSIIASNLESVKLFLIIDSQEYIVEIPKFEDIRSLICTRLDKIEAELEPLEVINSSIVSKAKFFSRTVVWIGFIYLITQTLIMARLTWWEYSWDITEPIAYFLTMLFVVAGYIYYLFTSKNFSFDGFNRLMQQYRIEKLRKKVSFNYPKYSKLISLKEYYKDKLQVVNSIINKD